MQTMQTYHSDMTVRSRRLSYVERVKDLHSVNELTVQPGERVVLEPDVTLVKVEYGFHPVVESTREDLELVPALRFKDVVCFEEEFTFILRDSGYMEEGIKHNPEGNLYVIAENTSEAPVVVRGYVYGRPWSQEVVEQQLGAPAGREDSDESAGEAPQVPEDLLLSGD